IVSNHQTTMNLTLIQLLQERAAPARCRTMITRSKNSCGQFGTTLHTRWMFCQVDIESCAGKKRAAQDRDKLKCFRHKAPSYAENAEHTGDFARVTLGDTDFAFTESSDDNSTRECPTNRQGEAVSVLGSESDSEYCPRYGG